MYLIFNVMIITQSYSLNSNVLLTNKILNVYISRFWNEVFYPLNNSNHLLLMCKIQFSDSTLGYRTLGHLRKVNFEDKELFIEYLSERLGLLNDSYHTNNISEIVFSYIIKEGLATGNRKLLQDLSDKSISTHSFNNMKLPISMNPEDYGILISKSIHEGFTRYIVTSNRKIFQIDISLDGTTNKVIILGLSDLTWTDTKLNESSTLAAQGEYFKRDIGKSTLYFLDGELVLKKQIINAKPFRKLKGDRKVISKFITMDIETINKNRDLIPYLICAFDGTDYISAYANKSLDQKQLFNKFFDKLITNFLNKSKRVVVYAHNLSGFDGIFLLKHLLAFGTVEPLLFNGKLISIRIKFNSKYANGKYYGKSILFKDSYLLLPNSLRMLCKAFGISIGKGYFPFLLNEIFYKGVLPNFQYWTGISLSEFNSLIKEYTGLTWSFKDEAIKYCKLDCQCLHQVLTKFNELIFNEFNVNINNSLTLPALAMRIYKIHFMPENTIYQLLGPVERNIRQSYSGGAVDVYIPTNRIGKFINNLFTKLFYYDANSLYPSVMANTPMPIGKPIYFEGDIRKIDPNAYGFFYCKITSPNQLDHPILQRRIKTINGLRTIAGLGTWEGWISSYELDNAVKCGYQFVILSGYQFEQGDIFSNYVNRMYQLRLHYEKGHPMNMVAKLLMNSLYGKFGMKLESTNISIFDTTTKEDKLFFEEMIELCGESIKDYVKVDNFYLIIKDSIINTKYDQDNDLYHGQDVNIAIASAITAGARVSMSYFKNNPEFNLYYSDTDSAVIDQPLPKELVGDALGKFKLEHTIEKAVFLAPKVYGLVTLGCEAAESKEIIKVKGITEEVTSQLNITDLEQLLVKDSSKEFNQDKWFKKILGGEISVSEIAYTLKVTSNKRTLLYVNNVFTSTKPYFYKDIIKK